MMGLMSHSTLKLWLTASFISIQPLQLHSQTHTLSHTHLHTLSLSLSHTHTHAIHAVCVANAEVDY